MREFVNMNSHYIYCFETVTGCHVQLLSAIFSSASVYRPLNTFDCIVSDVRVTTCKQCIIIVTRYTRHEHFMHCKAYTSVTL